jgi:hypothetical protein
MEKRKVIRKVQGRFHKGDRPAPNNKIHSVKVLFPIVLVLSLVTWVILYRLFPSAPPNAADTTVIVGFWILAVAALKSVAAVIRNRARRTN